MNYAIKKKGFTFIEVLAPCPTGFGRRNNLGEGLDEMVFYRDQSVVDNDAPLDALDIYMSHDSDLILGDFVDRERPLYQPMGTEPPEHRKRPRLYRPKEPEEKARAAGQ